MLNGGSLKISEIYYLDMRVIKFIWLYVVLLSLKCSSKCQIKRQIKDEGITQSNGMLPNEAQNKV